jgi:hypothetical protein
VPCIPKLPEEYTAATEPRQVDLLLEANPEHKIVRRLHEVQHFLLDGTLRAAIELGNSPTSQAWAKYPASIGDWMLEIKEKQKLRKQRSKPS